jgi:hypothetical protein
MTSRTSGAIPKDTEPAAKVLDDLVQQISQPLAAIVALARGSQLRARKQNLSSEDLERALESIAQEALRAGALVRTLRETAME